MSVKYRKMFTGSHVKLISFLVRSPGVRQIKTTGNEVGQKGFLESGPPRFLFPVETDNGTFDVEHTLGPSPTTLSESRPVTGPRSPLVRTQTFTGSYVPCVVLESFSCFVQRVGVDVRDTTFLTKKERSVLVLTSHKLRSLLPYVDREERSI